MMNPFPIEKRLEKTAEQLIREKPCLDFLVGRDGEFDLLAASVIRRTIQKTGYGNAALILVLSYMTAEFRDNEDSFLNYYNEVEICEKSSTAHYKSAIQIRNRDMIERSDLVICALEHNTGGAYRSVQYARRLGRNVINLAKIQ